MKLLLFSEGKLLLRYTHPHLFLTEIVTSSVLVCVITIALFRITYLFLSAHITDTPPPKSTSGPHDTSMSPIYNC